MRSISIEAEDARGLGGGSLTDKANKKPASSFGLGWILPISISVIIIYEGTLHVNIYL
jgi:hypothetical protein